MSKSGFVLSAAVCVLAAAAAPALAASDYFLQIEGVKGESGAQAAGQVEVSSFSWGASNPSSMAAGSGMGTGKVSMQDMSMTQGPVVSPRDAASGLPTGKRQHKPMMAVDAPTDGAAAGAAGDSMRSLSLVIPEPGNATSQYLDRACADGKHIDKAVLTGRAEQVEMHDVVVTSCSVAGKERKYEMRGHVTLIK